MNTAQSQLTIAFFDVKKEEEKVYLQSQFSEHTVLFSEETVANSDMSQFSQADVISVFISSALPAETLAQFPNLKYVTTRSTGYDHVDLEYCKANGIQVSSVPSYGENTVAEHAMALLLALMRRLPESIDRVKDGNFTPNGLTGRDMKGKTMGIIGTGHIGANVIQMAKGFNMTVLGYDVKQNEALAKELGFEYGELEDVLCQSDVISLHVPYLESTHHMINREIISKMKPGVIIINTSRGGLIETDALFDALQSGQVGGAGLDVLEEEAFLTEELELLYKDTAPDVDYKVALENHVLAHMPNVIVTPHNAFNSTEALQRITDTTVENINGFMTGNIVNSVIKA